MSGTSGRVARTLLLTLFAAIAATLYLTRVRDSVAVVIVAGVGWWVLAAGMIWAVERQRLDLGPHPLLRLCLGLPVLLPAWLSLVALHGRGHAGPELVLYLLVLVWGVDTAAYFAGRRWGRRKLCPHVSPGKTWAGLYGALLCGLILGAVFGLGAGLVFPEMLLFTLLTLVTVLASVIGDLLESLLKRSAAVKDSGTLLPGHGGVLDRVDSLTAAAPVFVAGLMLMERWS